MSKISRSPVLLILPAFLFTVSPSSSPGSGHTPGGSSLLEWVTVWTV